MDPLRLLRECYSSNEIQNVLITPDAIVFPFGFQCASHERLRVSRRSNALTTRFTSKVKNQRLKLDQILFFVQKCKESNLSLISDQKEYGKYVKHAIKEKIEQKENPDDFLINFVEGETKELKEKGKWSDKYGDRRNEVIFIGIGLDKDKMRTWLTQALISEEETAAMGGMDEWKKLKDPFWNGKMPDFAV